MSIFDDTEKLLRIYILDTLISKSGQTLTPEIISQLTSELLERIIDVLYVKK